MLIFFLLSGDLTPYSPFLVELTCRHAYCCHGPVCPVCGLSRQEWFRRNAVAMWN